MIDCAFHSNDPVLNTFKTLSWFFVLAPSLTERGHLCQMSCVVQLELREV